MGVMEIVLLVGGVILAGLSFCIPAARDEAPGEAKKLARDEIKTMVDQQMNDIRKHVDDVVDEAVGYAVEKTERSLERLTNEKIMAVNEYSDTVLQEIHKNHEEAVFLYDMLNNKQTGLKNMLAEMNKTVQEVEEVKREAEAVVSSFQQMEAESESARTEPQNAERAPVKKLSGLERLLAGTEKEDVPQETARTAPAEIPDAVKPAMDLNFMAAGENDDVNNNDKILKLYRQGKSKVAIAKELGLGVGEVKLVIDLYKRL